jgi:hypothetical protein
MELLGDMVKWKLVVSVSIEVVLILFWAQPLEVLSGVGEMEACFSMFRDSVNLATR